MPKVSVIVPVYNTEKYLLRCIDSILAQTFTDFELILVNDGSTDNSDKICDEYARKDNRIVVIHKENGGVSSARNRGIDVARGEWITFVDSDDYISETYLSDFPMESTHDMEICGMELFGYASKIYCPIDNKLYKSEISSFFDYEFDNPYITSPCVKLLKQSILLTYNIRFNNQIKITEDTLFIMEYMKYCNEVYLIKKTNYYYRYPENLQRKYRQDAESMSYNLTKLTNAIFELSEIFRFNPIKISQGLNRFHYSCFTANLNTLSDKDVLAEWKKYKSLRLHQYKFKMTFKESLYRFLSIHFPKTFYLRMRNR